MLFETRSKMVGFCIVFSPFGCCFLNSGYPLTGRTYLKLVSENDQFVSVKFLKVLFVSNGVDLGAVLTRKCSETEHCDCKDNLVTVQT